MVLKFGKQHIRKLRSIKLIRSIQIRLLKLVINKRRNVSDERERTKTSCWGDTKYY